MITKTVKFCKKLSRLNECKKALELNTCSPLQRQREDKVVRREPCRPLHNFPPVFV